MRVWYFQFPSEVMITIGIVILCNLGDSFLTLQIAEAFLNFLNVQKQS